MRNSSRILLGIAIGCILLALALVWPTPPRVTPGQVYYTVDSSGRLVMVGPAAAGSAVAGAPVLLGGSDGTNVRTLNVDTLGNLKTINVSTTGFNPCFSASASIKNVNAALSGTALTQIIAAVSGQLIYPCMIMWGNGGGTTPVLTLKYGTGVACATGTTTLLGPYPIPASTAGATSDVNVMPPPGPPVPGSNALCYILTGTTPTGTLDITYVQQ